MAKYAQFILLIVCWASLACLSQQKDFDKRQGTCDCGVANRNTRVINGNPTTANEYPWIGEVYKIAYNVTTGAIIRSKSCGGVMVNNDYVVSAAHCVFENKPSDIQVALGAYNLAIFEPNRVIVNVSEIIVHPSYNYRKNINDIVLLKLATSVAYRSNIKPICIPPPGLNLENQDLVIAGWGNTANGGPDSNVLLEATLPVIPNSECKAAYADSPNAVIGDSVLCAMYQGKTVQDACQGDSGGPATYECNGRYLFAGIVSYSKGCGTDPGVYTNVSYFRDWIVSKIPVYTLCGYDCYPETALPVCGMANKANQGSSGKRRKRVLGGSITEPFQYPWMVSVYIQTTANFFTCGATLISSKWVISAAKCVYGVKPSNITLVVGEYDQSDLTEPGAKDILASSVIIHPNYVDSTAVNNIALIQLSISVIYDFYVYPACLPTANSVSSTVSNAGTKFLFLGWGVDENNKYPNKLKQVSLTTVSSEQCKALFGQGSVDGNTMCTGSSPTAGVCVGDRGGPLMMSDKNGVFYQVGVLSILSSTCRATSYSIDLNIVPYLSWITSNTGVQPVQSSGILQ